MKKILLPGKHSITSFKEAFRSLELEGYSSVIVFGAEDTEYPKSEYDPILHKTSLHVTGGIFPEVLFEGSRYCAGTLLVGLKTKMKGVVFTDFDHDMIQNTFDKEFSDIDPEGKTIFIYVDAFALNKTNVTNTLYNSFGTLPNYVGGGTGSLNKVDMPNLFTNQGIEKRAASVSIADVRTSIGVSHGWQAISEPLKVTEAHHNLMKSLEWQPAMDIYRQVVEAHSKKKLDDENFFEINEFYAFGISRLNAEMVVRHPFRHENGAVLTLDNVDQGSHVHVMFAEPQGLLQGAQNARKISDSRVGPKKSSEVLIIDCISRGVIMGDDFDEELLRLDPEGRAFGALTLGEIANNGESFLEIFNKSAVVCQFHAAK